jgi:hypothetical protein
MRSVMPPNKRQIRLPNGDLVEGTVMPFQVGGEHWNEYFVEDGTVLRVKMVATEIVRLEGQYDQNGDPAYAVGSANVTSVSAPDRLRKKGDE